MHNFMECGGSTPLSRGPAGRTAVTRPTRSAGTQDGAPSRAEEKRCQATALQIGFAAILTVLTAGWVYAGGADAASPLPLDQAITIAMRDNPSLKSLRARWEAMQERGAQVSSLPNPMLTVGAMDRASGGSWPNAGERRIGIEQSLPWAGKRGLRDGMASREADAAGQDLIAKSQEIVMRVKESYFELQTVRSVLAITRKDEAVLARLESVAMAAYAAGTRPQQDVLQAKTEMTLAKQRTLELQGRDKAAKAVLKALLGRRVDAMEIEMAARPPDFDRTITLEAWLASAATNRPDIAAAKIRAEGIALGRSLAAKEARPDTRVGIEYRNLDGGDDMVMVTLGIDLPLRRGKIQAGVRESARLAESARNDVEAAEQEGSREVRETVAALETARETAELYRRELIPQAETRLASSETGYRAGKVDFSDVIESRRVWLQALIAAVTNEGEVGRQWARLERAVGGAL